MKKEKFIDKINEKIYYYSINVSLADTNRTKERGK